MAVAPKRKSSSARRDKRRSNVWKLQLPGIAKCSHCGELILSHRICKKCGYYAGRAVVKAAEEK